LASFSLSRQSRPTIHCQGTIGQHFTVKVK
jgi:hypothetical protein